MTLWMRGTNLWSVLLLGLGLTACESTSLVGAQPPTGGAGSSSTGGAGSSSMGGAGTGAPSIEGLTSSPDGTNGPWIFFDSLRALNRDIYAIQPDGSSLRRMTTSAAVDREPSVSPDGKTLAFASDRSGVFQVFLMPLPGGAVRQLTHRSEGADQPAWSPDGSVIAFRADTAIHLIGVDGAGDHQVADVPYEGIHAGHPTFASEKVLVYDTYHRIYTLDLDTGATKLLGSQTGHLQHPALSPDGHLLAFSVMCESGTNSVWLTPFASFEYVCRAGTRVTVGPGYGKYPAISSTGLIAFEHGEMTAGEIQTELPGRIGLADGTLTVVDVTHGEGDDRNASWSPTSLVLP